jgi:tetratricopeptide (TPR) repeat protein
LFEKLKKERPDRNKLDKRYALPAAPGVLSKIITDLLGPEADMSEEDKDLRGQIFKIADEIGRETNDARKAKKYFELANLLSDRAKKSGKEESLSKGDKLNAAAYKLYYMALNLDEGDPLYQASFALSLYAQGKRNSALEYIKKALKHRFRAGKVDNEQRDDLLIARAEILNDKKEFSAAADSLRKLRTKHGIERAGLLEKEINKGLKEAETEKRKKGKKPEIKERAVSPFSKLKKAFEGKNLFGTVFKLSANLGLFYGTKFMLTSFLLPIIGATASTVVLPFAGVVVLSTVPVIGPLLGSMSLGMIIIMALTQALVTFVFKKAVVRDIYEGWIKGRKEYSYAVSRKKDLAAKQKYAEKNPRDLNGHMRVIDHYIAGGNTESAVKYIGRTADLFSRHGVELWKAKYTSAEELASFALLILGLDVNNEMKQEIRALVRNKIIKELNALAPSTYLPDVVNAQLALA